ncbi:MAG: threonine/serine exporter family protein [Byssovorax sp.]
MNETPIPSTRSRVALHAGAAEAEAFVVSLAEALHSHGASAHRLEAMLTLVARRLDLSARFYSTPTAVLVSFGPIGEARTCLVRVEPGAIDLAKLSALYDAVVEVIHGDLTVEQGRAKVAAIVGARRPFSSALTVLAAGLASTSAAVIFGGGPREIAASFMVGIVVGAAALLTGRFTRGVSAAEPLGGLLAAILAELLAVHAGPLSTVIVILAGVIILLPGLGITTALTELATRHLAAGTARFAGAAVQLLGLAFGVGLGARVTALLPPAPAAPYPSTWPLPALALAVLGSALSSAVLFRARPRDLGWIGAGSAVAFLGSRAGAELLGPELGAFVGALLVGLSANLFARALDRPTAIVQVPGLVVLVPGSIGFRSLVSMLDNDVVSGVTAAFKMVLVATALVTGILLATILLPPKRAL